MAGEGLRSDFGIIAIAVKEVYALASTKKEEQLSPQLEALLEVARRVNWDALHGPMHLRTGRFRPSAVEPTRQSREDTGRAAEQGAEADGAAPRAGRPEV